jgi:hypothetical protein
MASRPGYPLPLLRPAPGATLIVLKLDWLGASLRHWSMCRSHPEPVIAS